MIPGAGMTIQIVNPTLELDHGTWYADWENPVLTPVTGCHVQASAGDVAYEHRSSGQSEYTVWLPWWALTPLTAEAVGYTRLRLSDGIDYDLAAPPMPWNAGTVRHVECLVKYVSG